MTIQEKMLECLEYCKEQIETSNNEILSFTTSEEVGIMIDMVKCSLIEH